MWLVMLQLVVWWLVMLWLVMLWSVSVCLTMRNHNWLCATALTCCKLSILPLNIISASKMRSASWTQQR